jgi:hypothetical protein
MAKAAQVVAAARRASCSVIHVCLGFEVGYPEISPANARFSALKERGLFIKGTESARVIHPFSNPVIWSSINIGRARFLEMLYK